MSMAAKLSDLFDETSGGNLQMEGHEDVLAQSAKDLWEPGALDSPPSHSPSWSLAQRPPSGCPIIKYCLDIYVTLVEELGAIPPPSHSWISHTIEGGNYKRRAPLWRICYAMLELDSLKQW